MPKSHRPYPPEFRQRLSELVRKGRTPEELARQFEPSAQAIRGWVKQAALESDAFITLLHNAIAWGVEQREGQEASYDQAGDDADLLGLRLTLVLSQYRAY
jgi:transposase-like protein